MADETASIPFSLNAGVALGVRTNLFATYRDTLATSLTQAQDLLATTTTDALGNPVDSQSGAPVVLINSFLGLSDTLYRMRVGTVSLRHHWPRDVFTLSGTWQSQDPITSANNTVPVSSSTAESMRPSVGRMSSRRAPPGWRRCSMGTSARATRLRATRLRATRPG